MFTKNGEWVKTSPWGNYLKDSTSKQVDRQREIGTNGTRTNNKKHKKPKRTLSVAVHKQPFYVGIRVSNVDWLIHKRFEDSQKL